MAFEALKMLQEKCGVTPDGAFGPNTAKAIVSHHELSPERGAHLLGQVVHESGTFRYTRENLNYSVDAMMKVWPSRFPTEESAEPFARNPKALAENVYFDRMGNDTKEKASAYIGRGFLWKICDEGVNDDTIKRLTKRINGGYTGLDHRIKETNKIHAWLK